MSFGISVGIRVTGFLNYTYFVLGGNMFKMKKSLWLLASWNNNNNNNNIYLTAIGFSPGGSGF
jgi:hypothetical protein